ncbi:MAG: response regulator transcription factor [Polyangiaceae bacterium]|jgi:DNA-binding CsgD family transcriptional regulator
MHARSRAALRASVERLQTFDPGEPVSASRLLTLIAQELHELLGEAKVTGAYRPARRASDWLVATEGGPFVASSFASVATSSANFLGYDPLRPKTADRNVVHTTERADFSADAGAFFDRIGPGLGQTRILLCDGPILLAWIGAMRPVGDRNVFERDLLRALALGVRRRLRIALGVPTGIARSTFEVSLDAYPGEAYVVRATGRVEYANALGAARLAVAARDLERELATTVAHHPNPSNGFELHPLRGRALPPFFLATRPSVCPGDLDRRIEHARTRWGLTPRRLEVLRRLALGDSSKDIAARLQISSRTVEEHVAAMMLLAKVDTRLRLVVRVWKGD